MQAGTVWTNSWMDGFAELPFGGVKESGQGRELGRYGLEEFLEVKTVQMRIGRTRAPWVDDHLTGGGANRIRNRGGNPMRSMIGTTLTALAALATSASLAAAADVEVLHWWTSGGEASALNVLKEDLAAQSIGWQDMPVAGGGGTQAMTVLRARVTSGNPPTAVQMLGFDALDWAKQGGVLADITPIATEGGWDAVVPEALQFFTKYDGKWISAPVNVHSTNWVWANKAILDELGIAPADDLGRAGRRDAEGEGRPARSLSPTAASPGRTRRSSTRSPCRPAARSSTRRPSSTSTPRRSARTR